MPDSAFGQTSIKLHASQFVRYAARDFRLHRNSGRTGAMGTYSICKNGKLYVWEAASLWHLSKDLPIKAVPLSSIANFDDVCWFHASKAKPTCRAVAAHAKRIYEADLSHPIILAENGIMMDGMHRVAKAWILGMEEIQAVQFLEDPPADQILPLPEKKKRHNTSLNLTR